MNLNEFIQFSLEEDIGEGDYTSLACIPDGAKGKAKLLVKDTGVIAGVELAAKIFQMADPGLVFQKNIEDGANVKYGDIVFTVEGDDKSILKTERLVLNCMQRMSGIATTTKLYVDRIAGLHTRVLDTRKTTPLMRELEKWAVRIGGGSNHRFGLYDMILVKDNHIDYAGGIIPAIKNVHDYLAKNKLSLPVEIETRNLDELKLVLAEGGVNRIMLDNFSPDQLKTAVDMVAGKYETEASGGINLETIRNYAETGVDYISVGALTHTIRSLDMSLKAFK